MSKLIINVEVDRGKEIVIKQNVPEMGSGKRRIPASSKVLASFKTGKGKIEWSIQGHEMITFEEFDNDH